MTKAVWTQEQVDEATYKDADGTRHIKPVWRSRFVHDNALNDVYDKRCL